MRKIIEIKHHSHDYECMWNGIEDLYHIEHLHFHYVLMVGYDDEKVYLYDCGRTELLNLSYDKLRESMNCSYPGLSKENTICTIRMNTSKNKYKIAKEAIAIKRDMFLNPPKGFLGYKGFEKFIKELSQWKTELEKDDYDKILTNMIMFFGTVPTIPNAIKGIKEPDTIQFKGGFDKMSKMLKSIGEEYKNDSFIQVAEIFDKTSLIIEKISNIIVDYLTQKYDDTDQLPLLFFEVLEDMKTGYLILNV